MRSYILVGAVGGALLLALPVMAKKATDLSDTNFVATNNGSKATPAYAMPNGVGTYANKFGNHSFHLTLGNEVASDGSTVDIYNNPDFDNISFFDLQPKDTTTGGFSIELGAIGPGSADLHGVGGYLQSGPNLSLEAFTGGGPVAIHFFLNNVERWRFDDTGETAINLAGSGNAQLCVDSTGKLYRGSPGC